MSMFRVCDGDVHCTNDAQSTCGGCTQTYYCSRACQRLHWQNGHAEACDGGAASRIGVRTKPPAERRRYQGLIPQTRPGGYPVVVPPMKMDKKEKPALRRQDADVTFSMADQTTLNTMAADLSTMIMRSREYEERIRRLESLVATQSAELEALQQSGPRPALSSSQTDTESSSYD